MLTSWKESYNQPRQHFKKQRPYFVNKGLSSQSYGLSSGHVWMWELDYKESWVLKNWCFWTVVLEKTLESPLECKEIQPVHPKGNQSWIYNPYDTLPHASSVISTAEGTTRKTSIHDFLTKDSRLPMSVDSPPATADSSVTATSNVEKVQENRNSKNKSREQQSS